MITIIALALNAALLYACYRGTNGNAALNLIASFALTVLVAWLMPEAHGMPFIAYLSVWLIQFVGLQFCLPAADGKVIIRRLPHGTVYQFGRVMVAVA